MHRVRRCRQRTGAGSENMGWGYKRKGPEKDWEIGMGLPRGVGVGG